MANFAMAMAMAAPAPVECNDHVVAQVQARETATHLQHHSYDSMDEMPSSYSSSLSQPGQSGSSSPPASPSPSASHEHPSSSADGNVRFIVLLLGLSGAHFDLVTVAADELALRSDSTTYDVLRLIQRKCAENHLSNDQYVGLVRTLDHVIFADLDARAFRCADAGEGEEPCRLLDGSVGEREYIEENDVLAAVLEGHSAHETIELAAPVLCSPAFLDTIGEKLGQGRKGGIFSVKEVKDERRNELQKIMRDRSLGKDERRSRTAEVKRRYDKLIERAERDEARLTEERRREEERGRASREASSGEQNEATLTEEESREEERGLFSMENLLADGGRTSIGEEQQVHCIHDANIASTAPGPIEKAVLRNAIDLVPAFDSKGKFTHHESRGVLDRGATSPLMRSARSYEDELRDIAEQLDGTAHRQNRRNCRRCAVVFAALFVVVAAIVLSGLTKEGVAAPTWREPPSDKSVQSKEAGAAATPSVTGNAPRPTNSPHTTVHSRSAKMFKVGKSDKGASGGVPSPDFALESATESSSTPTDSPTLANFVPTETSAPTDGKPTEKPTRRKHHGGRHSSAPTSKPTHKRHDHSDDKPTGKPAHKNHHGRHHSSAPTPKPTRKRHHHSDAPTTGKPTHRKHGHGGRHSSTPTPKPTRKHAYGGPVPGWFIQEECYDGVLC